jgi:hypothetical protein
MTPKEILKNRFWQSCTAIRKTENLKLNFAEGDCAANQKPG